MIVVLQKMILRPISKRILSLLNDVKYRKFDGDLPSLVNID